MENQIMHLYAPHPLIFYYIYFCHLTYDSYGERKNHRKTQKNGMFPLCDK